MNDKRAELPLPPFVLARVRRIEGDWFVCDLKAGQALQVESPAKTVWIRQTPVSACYPINPGDEIIGYKASGYGGYWYFSGHGPKIVPGTAPYGFPEYGEYGTLPLPASAGHWTPLETRFVRLDQKLADGRDHLWVKDPGLIRTFLQLRARVWSLWQQTRRRWILFRSPIRNCVNHATPLSPESVVECGAISELVLGGASLQFQLDRRVHPTNLYCVLTREASKCPWVAGDSTTSLMLPASGYVGSQITWGDVAWFGSVAGTMIRAVPDPNNPPSGDCVPYVVSEIVVARDTGSGTITSRLRLDWSRGVYFTEGNCACVTSALNPSSKYGLQVWASRRIYQGLPPNTLIIKRRKRYVDDSCLETSQTLTRSATVSISGFAVGATYSDLAGNLFSWAPSQPCSCAPDTPIAWSARFDGCDYRARQWLPLGPLVFATPTKASSTPCEITPPDPSVACCNFTQILVTDQFGTGF